MVKQYRYTRKARKSRKNRRVGKTRRGGGIFNSITGFLSPKKKSPLSSVPPTLPTRRHSNTTVNYSIMNSPPQANEPGYMNKLYKMRQNQDATHAAALAAKNMPVSKSF